MSESTVFIPAKKGSFIFLLVIFSLSTIVGMVMAYVVTGELIPLFIAAILFPFIWFFGTGFKIIKRLRSNKIGLLLTDNHLEDYSSFYSDYQVKFSNISSTEITSSMGKELLLVHLKSNKEFMKSIPFLKKMVYWLNAMYCGTPVVIVGNTLLENLHEVKRMIDERAG